MRKIILISILVSLLCDDNDLKKVNDERLIADITEKNTTWKAGKNLRFSNMTIGQAKNMLGLVKTDKKNRNLQKVTIPIQNLPENFDLRIQYPECESLLEVRDQANCGSCWAISVVTSFTDRICIASKGKLKPEISAVNLLSCCDTCGAGCNGGEPGLAWNYIQNQGLTTGGPYKDMKTCQPYPFPPCSHHMVGSFDSCGGDDVPFFLTPKCNTTCIDGYSNDYDDDKWFTSDSFSVDPDEVSIMNEIFQGGSVVVSIDVYDDFLVYQSGIYQHVSGLYNGGHAIKVIGWGIENNVKYWICVNSWNSEWGDKGFFKFLKGEDHLSIESYSVAGTPILKSLFFLS